MHVCMCIYEPKCLVIQVLSHFNKLPFLYSDLSSDKGHFCCLYGVNADCNTDADGSG